MMLIHGFVEPLDEADGLQALSSSVHVGNPLPFLSPIVKIEHGGDGIHSEAVRVILLEPEEGTADEEGPDLVSAVVENVAFPIWMIALLGIGMFVEVGPVKIGQPVNVIRKMGRHPIENDPDTLLVKLVDEGHEILRIPVPCGGCEVTHGLISPGAVEGVLHDGKKLDVGEPHLFHIIDQIGSHLPISERTVPLLGNASPGTEVNLID
jgi:hypothetical protein